MHRLPHVSCDKNFHNNEQDVSSDKKDDKEFQHSELNELEELVTDLQEIADNFDLYTFQGDNRSITPRSQVESPVGNIGQNSFIHPSNRNSSSSVETCNNVRHDTLFKNLPVAANNHDIRHDIIFKNLPVAANNHDIPHDILFKNLPVAANNHDIPPDTSISNSIFQIPHNEVQPNLSVSLQTSSKHFEPDYRFENCFCRAQKRKLSTTEVVYKKNDCEIKSTTSFHFPTSGKCDVLLEEEKLHSLNKDKEFFLESLEDAAKTFRLEFQNMSKAFSFKQCLFFPGNKQSNTDVVEVSTDIRIGDISSEIVSQLLNRSVAMPENVKKILNSSKHTNAVAGPFGIRLQSLKPANKIKFTCDICCKKCTRKSQLERHYRCHTGEKPFLCDVCGRGFAEAGTLKSHYLTHTRDTPFVCDVCNRGFVCKKYLDAHVRIHMAKPFTCDICCKKCIRKSQLDRHYRCHTGEKPFLCDVCGRGFADREHLKSHHSTHTRNTLYLCDVCNRGFVCKKNLDAHVRIHMEKPFTCDICNRGYVRKKSLLRHFLIHTKEKSH